MMTPAARRYAAGLRSSGSMRKPVAMPPNKGEDASCEINGGVQIVSRPPDFVMSQDIVDSFFNCVAPVQAEATERLDPTTADHAEFRKGFKSAVRYSEPSRSGFRDQISSTPGKVSTMW